MLSTEVSGHSGPALISSHNFNVNDKNREDKIMSKTTSTSRPNDYTIEKLLNTPSSSASSLASTTAMPLSSSVVLNQFSKLNQSQIPIDLLAQTLWLQQQHLHHKLVPEARNNLALFEANESPLLTNSSPICQSAAHLRRYLLPQQRPNRGPRRQRTTFTHEQTLRLEMEYHVSEYITRGKRFQLAELLDLSENQIKIWFQNRRAKDKRIEKAIVEQQYRYLSSPPFHQHLNVSNCSTCNYTKQQFSTEQN